VRCYARTPMDKPRPKARRSSIRKARRIGRPPGQLGEDTRKAILIAARDCFARLGFERATNAAVAEAAGVTAAAMYRHFESKPDLYAAVVHDALDDLVPRLRRAIAGQTGARAALRAMIEMVGSLNAEQLAAMRFLSDLPAEMQRHPQINRRMLGNPGAVFAIVNDIVAAGVQAGEISQARAPRAVAMMIALLMGISTYRNTLGPALGAEAIAGVLDVLDNQLFRSSAKD
jgi:TetR/AcrR family transcriptional repressor of mexJK operon